jgi:hypothetical protein
MSDIKKINNRLQTVPKPLRLGGVLPAELRDEVVTLGQINDMGVSAPYKKYVALLTQTSTNAPTAIILENTVGDIVWTRSDAGVYVGTLAGAFGTDNTFIIKAGLPGVVVSDLSGNTTTALVSHSVGGADTVYLSTFENGEVPADDWLYKYPIEIRVY